MLRLEKLINNGILIALFELKKVGILQIVIVFPSCIIYRATKQFFNILYWPLSLPPMPVIAKE